MAIAKTNLQKLKTDQESNYPAGTRHLALLSSTLSTYSFTVNSATNVLTCSATHDYLAGTKVRLSSTSALPTSSPQVLISTDYLVTSPSGATLQLTTVDGTPIDFTDVGAGILTIVDVLPDEETASLAEWLRKEVASYQGLANRPTLTMPAESTITAEKKVRKALTADLDNSTGTNPLAFTRALLIVGGTSAPGNTSGSWTDYYTWDTTQTVAAGDIVPFTFEILNQNINI